MDCPTCKDELFHTGDWKVEDGNRKGIEYHYVCGNCPIEINIIKWNENGKDE